MRRYTSDRVAVDTITLFAKDNANEADHISCESQVVLIPITVAEDEEDVDASYSENDTDEESGGSTSAASSGMALTATDSPASTGAISGSAKPGSSIAWTNAVDSAVVDSGSIVVDAAGYFSFAVDNTVPGHHVVHLIVTAPQTQQVRERDVEFFVNNISVGDTTTSPGLPPFGEVGRFSPRQGQSASAVVTSQLNDPLDIQVIDPFDSPACADRAGITRADDLLNGIVNEKVVKTIHIDNSQGSSTVTWDGKDATGSPLPAGPYIIRVSRTNADELLAASYEDTATIDSTPGVGGAAPPVISEVNSKVVGTSIAISWKTDVPTAGAVLYSEQGNAVGRVRADDMATFHVAYLPVVTPDTAYSFWVFGKAASGSTAVSQMNQVSSGEGENLGNLFTVTPVSETAVKVQWSTPDSVFGRVRYAKTEINGGQLVWASASEAAAATDHMIQIDGLSSNSEYVYRVDSCGSSDFANASASSYQRFTTKTTAPAVRIGSPAEGAVVSGLIPVTVVASDSVARFGGNGISRVELLVDDYEGTPMALTSPAPSTNDYCFTIDTSTLARGNHQLIARAMDDFGNVAEFSREMCVGDSGGAAGTSATSAIQALGLTDPITAIQAACIGVARVAPMRPRALNFCIGHNMEYAFDSSWNDLKHCIYWDNYKGTVGYHPLYLGMEGNDPKRLQHSGRKGRGATSYVCSDVAVGGLQWGQKWDPLWSPTPASGRCSPIVWALKAHGGYHTSGSLGIFDLGRAMDIHHGTRHGCAITSNYDISGFGSKDITSQLYKLPKGSCKHTRLVILMSCKSGSLASPSIDNLPGVLLTWCGVQHVLSLEYTSQQLITQSFIENFMRLLKRRVGNADVLDLSDAMIKWAAQQALWLTNSAAERTNSYAWKIHEKNTGGDEDWVILDYQPVTAATGTENPPVYQL